MTRDDIIRMAREAGFANVRGGLMDNGEISDYWDCWPGQLERFYHLAYAAGEQAERDRTKRLVEDMQNELRQRPRLTDEEIQELSQQHKFDSRMEKFVRIIERKVRGEA